MHWKIWYVGIMLDNVGKFDVYDFVWHCWSEIVVCYAGKNDLTCFECYSFKPVKAKQSKTSILIFWRCHELLFFKHSILCR